MIQLLAFCLCCSLAITAVHTIITRPGMILSRIPAFCHKIGMPSYIQKPLFDCMICMSSVWTIALAFVFNPPLGACGQGLVLAILIVAGINTLICAVLDKLTDYGC